VAVGAKASKIVRALNCLVLLVELLDELGILEFHDLLEDISDQMLERLDEELE